MFDFGSIGAGSYLFQPSIPLPRPDIASSKHQCAVCFFGQFAPVSILKGTNSQEKDSPHRLRCREFLRQPMVTVLLPLLRPGSLSKDNRRKAEHEEKEGSQFHFFAGGFFVTLGSAKTRARNSRTGALFCSPPKP